MFEQDHEILYVDIASVVPAEGIRLSSCQRLPFGQAPGRARRTIRSKDVLVSTVRPYLRAVARVQDQLDGEVASTGFTVLRAGECVEPGFVFLLTQTDDFVAWLMDRATGSNYPAVRPLDVASYPVVLAPLAEQRRIVDILAAVDQVITATQSTIEPLRRALTATLSECAHAEGPRVPLGDFVKMSSGPSWKANQEGTTPDPGAIPVLKITNTRPDGRVVVGDPAFVSGLPPKTMRLDSSCLVVIRTNGNRARIGNVYRVPTEAEGHAVSAFQIAMKPHDPSDTDYLYCFLSSPSVQAAISAAASGTTGLGNIGIGWLKELVVPWALPENRASIISRVNAISAAIDAAEREHAASVDLRTALLADLLSGAHEIPESYDRLLESA